MSQLEQMEAIEKRLRKATDTLRTKPNYASNEYVLPVMGRVFLRHAYSRFLVVKESIDVDAYLPKRGVKIRPSSEEDLSLREIHVVEDLNVEAAQLAATIKKNFEVLGI